MNENSLVPGAATTTPEKPGSANAIRREKVLLELKAMELQTEKIQEQLHVIMRNSPSSLAVANYFNSLLNSVQQSLFEYDKLIKRVTEEYRNSR